MTNGNGSNDSDGSNDSSLLPHPDSVAEVNTDQPVGAATTGCPLQDQFVTAFTRVTPEVAAEIQQNIEQGEPPFKPELGKAGNSWFVSEGNPYTGISADKTVLVEALINRTTQPQVFDEARLQDIFQAKLAEIDAEQNFRAIKNLPAELALNSKQRKAAERLKKRAAEDAMWEEVGRQVREAANQVGEVALVNSAFSKQGDGKFLVVADPGKISQVTLQPEADT